MLFIANNFSVLKFTVIVYRVGKGGEWKKRKRKRK